MDILVLKWLFITTTIAVIECAPKLGHLLFDPLIHEARLSRKTLLNIDPIIKISLPATPTTKKLTKASLSTKILISPVPRMVLRNNEDEKPRSPCQGYDFDDSICKPLDTRIVCGYNKNVGELKDDEIIDMGNGCRLIHGRIECGYVTGPFDKGNTRRSSATNDVQTTRLLNKMLKSLKLPAVKEELRDSNEKTEGSKTEITTNIIASNNATIITSTEPTVNKSSIRKKDTNPKKMDNKTTTSSTMIKIAITNSSITQIKSVSSNSSKLMKIPTTTVKSNVTAISSTTESSDIVAKPTTTKNNIIKSTIKTIVLETTTKKDVTTSNLPKQLKRDRRSGDSINNCVDKGDYVICYDF